MVSGGVSEVSMSGSGSSSEHGSSKSRFSESKSYESSRAATTHVVFEPLDLMAKSAALVPRPRTNLAGPRRPGRVGRAA